VTAEKRRRFLEKFAEKYDLPGAAAAAKIGRTEAYRILKTAREEVDRLVQARVSGQVLFAIRREYERMAFGEGEDVRPAERIRAMENLRLMASQGREDGGAPGLVIQYEYV